MISSSWKKNDAYKMFDTLKNIYSLLKTKIFVSTLQIEWLRWPKYWCNSMKIKAQYQIPEVKSHIYMYIVCQTQIESIVGIKPTKSSYSNPLSLLCLSSRERLKIFYSLPSLSSPTHDFTTKKSDYLCTHPTFYLKCWWLYFWNIQSYWRGTDVPYFIFCQCDPAIEQ